jgi:cob(I)alamin adenosyltransferase
MKIYTKKGDKGITSLIGGIRVPKHSERINAYGTIDELNANIGLVRDVVKDVNTKDVLYKIQNQFFVLQKKNVLLYIIQGINENIFYNQ